MVSGSTGEGLEQLAASEGAALIVFGSDYRTPPGHAEPGNTAQHLLEGAPVAIAVAAAGLRTDKEGAIGSVSVAAGNADTAAIDTAKALAETARCVAQRAATAPPTCSSSDRPDPAGRIGLSGLTRTQLNSARGSVLVVPHGTPVTL